MHDLMPKIKLNYSCTEEVQVNSFKNSLLAGEIFHDFFGGNLVLL